MRESVIQRGKPLHGPRIIEVFDHMHVAAKRREELSRRNVPIPSMICGGATGGAAANCRNVTISRNAGATAPKSTAMSTCSLV